MEKVLRVTYDEFQSLVEINKKHEEMFRLLGEEDNIAVWYQSYDDCFRDSYGHFVAPDIKIGRKEVKEFMTDRLINILRAMRRDREMLQDFRLKIRDVFIEMNGLIKEPKSTGDLLGMFNFVMKETALRLKEQKSKRKWYQLW